MNTVDALNELGKALLGDSYEQKIGLTDAETIQNIAAQVEEAGGLSPSGGDDSGSDTTSPFIELAMDYDTGNISGYTFDEIYNMLVVDETTRPFLIKYEHVGDSGTYYSYLGTVWAGSANVMDGSTITGFKLGTVIGSVSDGSSAYRSMECLLTERLDGGIHGEITYGQ